LNIPDGCGSFQTSKCEIICGYGGITGGTTYSIKFNENIVFIETVGQTQDKKSYIVNLCYEN